MKREHIIIGFCAAAILLVAGSACTVTFTPDPSVCAELLAAAASAAVLLYKQLQPKQKKRAAKRQCTRVLTVIVRRSAPKHERRGAGKKQTR